MKPVVLAGGSGSRLWPKSRAALPKQFLSLTSDLTMLQDTIARLEGSDAEQPIVICNDAHRFLVAEQLRQQNVQHGGILLEPMGRNTAPAIALAALHACLNNEDPILLILAADHLINDAPAFHKAITQAETLAKQGKLVTFGIVPDSAHTGYGYIKRGDKVSSVSVGFDVAEFVEKPDLATAQQYVDSGEFYWNSGMFMFKASRYLQELEKYAPDMLAICKKAIASESTDLEFVRVDANVFETCPDDSIDYAVMEPLCRAEGSESVVVVPLDAAWNDIGSFSAIWDLKDKDENGNVHQGDVLSHGSTNSLVSDFKSGLLSINSIGRDTVIVASPILAEYKPTPRPCDSLTLK